jgi:hypothetical protein
MADGVGERVSRPSVWPKLGMGCAGVLVLLVGGLAGARAWAGSRLDARAASLQADIQRFEAGPIARPPRGAAPVEGNAVDEYRAIEWILAPGDRSTPWPGMATPGLERDHPKAHGVDLGKVLGQGQDAVRQGEPLPAATLDALRTYAPVIEHVRAGLRRTQVDWGLRLEDGVEAELPNLAAAREAALLVALDAETLPDDAAAVRDALDAVAFGDDVARQGTLIAAMVGLAVRRIGLEELERLMRGRTLPAATYLDVVTTLGELGDGADLARSLEAERLGMEATLASLGGRSLSTGRPPQPQPLVQRLLGPLFFEREWRTYDDAFGRLVQAVALPAGKRGPAVDAITSQLQASSSTVAAIAIPDLGHARDHLDEVIALARATRVVAAAHLVRLETGAFPADAAPLAAKLGGALPTDPFRPDGGPLSYALRGDEVRCWSIGPDGTDQGGKGGYGLKEPERPDDVVVTRAPPSR